jgi:glycosyltransferase involved in cell wall biosynthesis
MHKNVDFFHIYRHDKNTKKNREKHIMTKTKTSAQVSASDTTSVAPAISIIMPNRNYGYYIRDSLNSVLHQTFTDWECLIIDDASTDNSVEIIQEFVKKDKRFRLFQNSEYSGISATRNVGLDNARGDYIAFLDSDDCYTEYALESLMHLAQQTRAHVVGGFTNIVPAPFKYIPRENQVPSNRDVFEAIFTNTQLLHTQQGHKWCWIWRRIYKREMIGDTRFLPELKERGDDSTFMLDISYKTKPFVETTNTVVFHRYHAHSITQTEFSTRDFDWIPIHLKHIRDNLLDKYDFTFFRTYYTSVFTMMLQEMIVKPHKSQTFQQQARNTLIQSCRLIPLRYLPFKYKALCWFLSCLRIRK